MAGGSTSPGSGCYFLCANSLQGKGERSPIYLNLSCVTLLEPIDSGSERYDAGQTYKIERKGAIRGPVA